MARRKSKYPDKPYTTPEYIRRRFEALMDPKKVKKMEAGKNLVRIQKSGLWDWNTLEDVEFD